MGITGLGNYSSTNFYYKTTNKNNNTNVNDESAFGLLAGKMNNQDETADTVDKPARTSVTVPYTRCTTAAIQTEEKCFSEKAGDLAEEEEIVTPLGFGFANAGMMGYGMSAALVEKSGCDDTIIRVKLATGSGEEVIDVDLSKFDSRNATPVEMFAYCQYKDALGEGVNNKWGSWNALKGIALTENGADFGSLDNIMNKKMNWNHALAKSQTSYMDPKTNDITLDPSDLMKLLKDSHNLTAQTHKGEKGWREMTDEEWDKMLEGIDKYTASEEAKSVIGNGISKLQEVQLTDNTTVGIAKNGAVTECASAKEDEKVWTVTAFTENGIVSNKCQNGQIIGSWEIKYSNSDDAKRVQELLDFFDKDVNLIFSGSKEFWEDFLRNNKSANDILSAHGEVFDKSAPNAPASVKAAWMDAAKATGYLEGGKMNHISQLLIRQVINRENGVEDYQNVFGNSVASAMQAAKELLYDLENPLTPISERGENAREYIEQEKEFYKKFIENLEEIFNHR